MRQAKSLSANAAWSLFVGLIWPTLLMLATTRIYLQFLGVRHYAVYAVANAVVMVAGTLRLGATEATVKYVAHHRADQDTRRLSSVVGATLLIYMAAAVVGSVCIYAGAPVLVGNVLGFADAEAGPAIAAIRVAAMGFPANLLVSAASSVFAGFERYDKATLLSSSLATVGAVAGTAVLAAGAGIKGLFTATVATNWLVAVTAIAVAWRWCGLYVVSWPEYVESLKTVMGFGLYSSVNALAYTAFNTVDRLIVGAVLGPEAVAYYSVTASVASRIYTVSIATTQALLPRISALRAAASPRETEGRTFYSSLAIVVLFGAAAAATLSGTSHGLLKAWLGAEFAERAWSALAVQSWTYALLATSVVPYYYLNAIGRPGVASRWFALGAVVQYPMMYVAGRLFGMAGILVAIHVFPVALTGMLRAATHELGASRESAREVGWLARNGAVLGIGAALLGVGAGAASRIAGIGGFELVLSLSAVLLVGVPTVMMVGRRRLETLASVTQVIERIRLRLAKWGVLRA